MKIFGEMFFNSHFHDVRVLAPLMLTRASELSET